MKAILIDVIALFASLFLFCIFFSLYSLYKRQKLLKNKRRQFPLPSELRKRRIPVIESTPFWVPSYIGHMVDIEVQPSLENLGPRFSTPKPWQSKTEGLSPTEHPQLKFSVKYNTTRSTLLVELLESRHLGLGNLVRNTSQDESEPSFLSGTGIFPAVELSPREARDSLPVVRRTRKNSYEFEMSYEDLQLQSLQFSVMARDEYSRQKIIGDVILPMAEFTSKGLDVTKELIMWREIQTMEKKTEAKMGQGQVDQNKNLFDSTRMDDEPSMTSSSRCSPS